MLEPEEESIMMSDWPEYKDEWNFEEDEKADELSKKLSAECHNGRTGMNVPPSRKPKYLLYVNLRRSQEIFAEFQSFLCSTWLCQRS